MRGGRAAAAGGEPGASPFGRCGPPDVRHGCVRTGGAGARSRAGATVAADRRTGVPACRQGCGRAGRGVRTTGRSGRTDGTGPGALTRGVKAGRRAGQDAHAGVRSDSGDHRTGSWRRTCPGRRRAGRSGGEDPSGARGIGDRCHGVTSAGWRRAGRIKAYVLGFGRAGFAWQLPADTGPCTDRQGWDFLSPGRAEVQTFPVKTAEGGVRHKSTHRSGFLGYAAHGRVGGISRDDLVRAERRLVIVRRAGPGPYPGPAGLTSRGGRFVPAVGRRAAGPSRRGTSHRRRSGGVGTA